MRGREVLFSSKTDEWETPQDFFDKLDKEFHFELDVAATSENAKCAVYYGLDNGVDGLSAEWEMPWGPARVWCNPPYSNIKEWAKRCSEHKNIAVMLVPARTDTKWFHDYCYNKPYVEIRFIKGRLKFGNAKNSAPFPSMLVIFHGDDKYGQNT